MATGHAVRHKEVVANYPSRRFLLREVLLEILQEHPLGLLKQDLLNHAQNRCPCEKFSARYFGLDRLSDSLHEFKDLIVEFYVEDRCCVQLKKKHFRKTKDIFQERRFHLAQTLYELIEDNPGGIEKTTLWNLLEKRLQFIISPQFYGLECLTDFLGKCTGIIDEFYDENNKCYINFVKNENKQKKSKDTSTKKKEKKELSTPPPASKASASVKVKTQVWVNNSLPNQETPPDRVSRESEVTSSAFLSDSTQPVRPKTSKKKEEKLIPVCKEVESKRNSESCVETTGIKKLNANEEYLNETILSVRELSIRENSNNNCGSGAGVRFLSDIESDILSNSLQTVIENHPTKDMDPSRYPQPLNPVWNMQPGSGTGLNYRGQSIPVSRPSNVQPQHSYYGNMRNMPGRHGGHSDDSSAPLFASSEFPSLSRTPQPVDPRSSNNMQRQQSAPTPIMLLKDKIVMLLNDNPSGIDMCSFWNKYQNRYRESVRASDYGVRKLKDILDSMVDTGTLKCKSNIIKLRKPSSMADVPFSYEGSPTSSEPHIDLTKKQSYSDLVPKKPKSTAEDFLSFWGSGATSQGSSQPEPMNTPPVKPSTSSQPDVFVVDSPAMPLATRKLPERKPVNVTLVDVPRGSRLSSQQIESIAKDCIDILSDAQEYVSPERIEKLLLQRLSMHSLRELNVRYLDQIKCVNEHNRMLCKVNAYIQAFVKVRSLCTLAELSECSKDFASDGGEFSSLKLGPLQRLPVVFDLFKFPIDEEIPEISSLDILQHLREYMTKFNKWSDRLETEHVMDYLVAQYDVPNAYHLGIRLRSLPLCAQVLKKAQRDDSKTRKLAYDRFIDETKKEVAAAFMKFKAAFLKQDQHNEPEIREYYLKLQPEFAVSEIFRKFLLLMSINQPTTKTERKQHAKLQSSIQEFLSAVRTDELGKMLLHLAICVSDLDLQEAAMELMSPSEPAQSGDNAEASVQPRVPPNRADLLELLKKYVDRCLTHGTLNLNHLDRIEEKLCEDFGFGHFSAMGFGRYLSFLLTDPSAKSLLEESGGTILGASSSVGDGEMSFRPQQSDVMECMKQCKNCGAQTPEEMENTVGEQYRVKEFKHLGLGNINRLVSQLEKHGKRHSNDFTVAYEAAICGSNCVSTVTRSQVGVLGHQTKESALACLHNCPLLTDLAEWSHWSLVFEAEHGKLKDFVQKYGGVKTTTVEGTKKIKTDITALEIAPGKLLKLVSETSTDKFSIALEERDALKTAGHFVSIVVESKGVKSTPLALLSNHMKTNLFSMHSDPAKQNLGMESSELVQEDTAVTFVLDCLVKLPLRICAAVANQMFIDPLGQVVGSTKSKQLLWKSCQSFEQYKRLEELGFLLGIDEWMKSFQNKCKIPEEAVEVVRLKTAEEEEFFMEEEEEEEEEDSYETESESDVIEISSGESESEEESDDEDEEEEESDVVVIEKTTEKAEVVRVKNEPQEQSDSDAIDEVAETAEKVQDLTSDADVEIVTTDSEDQKMETEIVVSDTEEDKCLAVINQIRRDEFGIGIELNEDGERLMKVQQDRLGRSLDRLSKDLYSKDTHFVLELLQNADDNAYPDEFFQESASTIPSVKFIMGMAGVTVHNNECGFQEKDVRALCDVGRSTKGKHKYGYIGQKGIGFKSVFRITDRPEVHSNGYHICFDVKSGPTGYILPHWLENEEELDDMWATKIFLPLKESLTQQIRSLAARFNDIHPSLLLFLHRIKHIMIENQIEHTELSMIRKDKGCGVIEICHNSGIDRWLVVKKMLDASNVSQQTKSGVDVESTEIALAFPVRRSGERSVSQVLPAKQPVFAFLPLRSYGLRFIVQGDFDVPSSREDVDRDSPWNQWLRNELPNLFLEALEAFKAHADFRGLEAVSAYLQFVPMEDEVLDFFRPFAAQILQKLKAKACIPTQPNSRGAMSWKIPSQTVAVRDMLVRDVVTPELLQKHLDLYYIHTDVAAMLNPSLTHTLGIETLTTTHLLQIGGTLAQTWEGDKGTDKRSQILTAAKWLACIYRSLDEFKNNDEVFTSLQQLKIIPLSSGEFTALSIETVFLPLTQASADTKTAHGRRDPLAELHRDLNTIHIGLINTSDNEVNSQVQKLLLKIGVRQLQPSDVINHHIMPVLKTDAWQNKSRDVLICYMIYIKEQLDRQPGVVSMDDVIKYAQVITNHKIQNPAVESVHFTPAYGNKLNLSSCFPGYSWVLLDSCYVVGSSQHEMLSWRNFFIKLGVTDFLSVKQKKVEYTAEQLEESPWKVVKTTWPPSSDGYVINDYQCDEFYQLVACNRQPTSFEGQMKLMFEIIDRDWDSLYSKCGQALVCDKRGSHLKDECSSFEIHLRTLAWVPAVEITMQPQLSTGTATRVDQTHTLEPTNLYTKSHTIEMVLGHMVKYLNAEVSQRSSFCTFLGIKSSTNVDTVKDLLIQYTQHKGTICFSLQHIKEIYKFLLENLTPKISQDLFHDHAVIFLPDKFTRDNYRLPNTVLTGKMISRKDVWWEDVSGLFNKHRHLLEEYHSDICHKRVIGSIYGDISEMLQRTARIIQHPSLDEYCELLNVMSAMLSLTDKQVVSDVLDVYSVIGEQLLRNAEMANNLDYQTQLQLSKEQEKKLVNMLKVLKVFITKKSVWVGLKDMPMISDNKEMEKLFLHQENVHLLDLEDKNIVTDKRRSKRKEMPQRKMDAIMAFLELTKIPKLSEQIQLQEVTQLMEPCPTLQLFFHKLVPLVQQYLYTQYEDVYRKLIDDDIAKHLKSAVFMQMDKLEVKYTLKNNAVAFVIRAEKCIITAEYSFYFHKNSVDSFIDINKEISRIFCGGVEECKKELRSFLSELSPLLLQNNPSEDEIKQTLENYEVEQLPDEEVVWEIQPPIIYQPEPDSSMEQDEFIDESDQMYVMSEGGSTALRSWPPKSSAEGYSGRPHAVENLKGSSNIWPPPEQPEYMKSVKDLPPQIKIVREEPKDKNEQTITRTETERQRCDDEQAGPHFTRSTSTESGSTVGKKEGISADGRPTTMRSLSNTSSTTESSVRPKQEGDATDTRRSGQKDDTSASEHRPQTAGPTGPPPLATLGEHIESERRKMEEPDDSELSRSGDDMDQQKAKEYSGERRGSFPTTSGGKRRMDSEEGDFAPAAKKQHALQFGLPSWSDTALDYSYEELGRGRNLKIPESISLEKGAQTDQIGRWGELVVYHYLLQCKEVSDDIIDVIWVNKREETGDPYDFEIVHLINNEEVLKYVEVKSTISNTKEVFEISSQQIRFAMDKRQSFHVYRLFGAGDPENVRLVRIENLCQRMDSSDVKLCLVI